MTALRCCNRLSDGHRHVQLTLSTPGVPAHLRRLQSVRRFSSQQKPREHTWGPGCLVEGPRRTGSSFRELPKPGGFSQPCHRTPDVCGSGILDGPGWLSQVSVAGIRCRLSWSRWGLAGLSPFRSSQAFPGGLPECHLPGGSLSS